MGLHGFFIGQASAEMKWIASMQFGIWLQKKRYESISERNQLSVSPNDYLESR